jgi:hypothetical protein
MRWALLLLAACGGDPPLATVAAVPDAAAPEAEAPSTRTLIEQPLVRRTTERVLHPGLELDVFSGGWIAFTLGAAPRPAIVFKQAWALAPEGPDVLALPGRDRNPAGVTVIGFAMAQRGLLDAHVWVGKRGARAKARAILHGFHPERGPISFDLQEGETRDAEGFTWTRYAAAISDGPVGWAVFQVASQDDEEIVVNGPSVMAPTAGWTGVGTRSRATTPAEMRLIRAIPVRFDAPPKPSLRAPVGLR